MTQLRMTVQNRRNEKMLLFIEPEAWDIWLFPNEECELVAKKENEEGKFELWYTDQGITVFPSRGCGSISVYQKKEVLECGHQRPSVSG